MEHPVHTHKCGRCIGAASCHACCHRDKFTKLDGKSLFNIELLHQHLCCFIYKISLICGDKRKIGRQYDPRPSGLSDIQDIIHTDGLHDHAYLMITVLSLSQNIKSEIDLCHCF